MVNLVFGLLFAAVPGYDTFICHRGESFDAPENTLPAYRMAVDRGFGFECDVYLSKDERVFTFHDSDLKRTTDGAKRGIMGGSMGGHGACYLGMRHKDLFGVIGNIYGGVDLVPWSSNWDIAKRLGPRDQFPERWVEHSVVNVAKTLKNGEVDLICALGTEDFFLGCNRQLHEILSGNGVAHTYVEVRSPTTLQSVHGKFYNQGAEICLRFIHNYFQDGFGHLGDIR